MAMLNANALSELFSNNTDQRLYKRWFLMTPSGTLFAYSEPTDIRDLRKQAAMATLAWQNHSERPIPAEVSPGGERDNDSIGDWLTALTIESDSSNLIIRKIQPQLLLALEGGVPPRKHSFEPRTTPEGPRGAHSPSHVDNACATSPVLTSDASSIAGSSKSSVASSVLALQRRKVDALASAIFHELEQTGFQMPNANGARYF